MGKYIPLVWKDRNIQRPNTFQVVDNPDGTKTLVPKPGTVVEEGTKVNAQNLNNIEQGIKDLDINVNDIQIAEVTINDSITNLDVESLVTIKSIKGRTLKNEIKNGNFAEVSPPWRYWSATYGTVSVANNVLSLTSNGQARECFLQQTDIFNSTLDKYYISAEARVTNDVCDYIAIGSFTASGYIKVNKPQKDVWYKLTGVKQGYTDKRVILDQIYVDAATANGKVLEIKNVMCINLTAMFGTGKEPTVEWCDSNLQWFDGIKSVGENENNKITINSIGKNLIDMSKIAKNYLIAWNNGFTTLEENSFATDYISVIPGENYICNYYSQIMFYDKNRTYLGNGESLLTTPGIQYKSFKAPNDSRVKFLRLGVRTVYNGNLVMYNQNVQLEKGITETIHETYKFDNLEVQLKEPHRGLPNGISDEIISGKNIKRVGKVVFNGSESISLTTVGTNTVLFGTNHLVQSVVKKADNIDIISDNFPSKLIYSMDEEGCFTSVSGALYIRILKNKLSTPDLAGFKAWLTSNPTTVYYELDAPIEESLNQSLNIKTYNKGTILLENSIIPTIELDVPSNVAGRVSNLEEFIPIINSGIDIVNKELTSHKASNDHDNRYVKLSDIKNTILNTAYPIGAIYQSVVNTSPAVFLGGTWVSIATGRTLVGVDTSDTDFNVAEKTGGSKSQQLRALIGATHSDLSKIGYNAVAPVPGYGYNMGISGSAFGGATETSINHSTLVTQADGKSVTTIQPYITVYMWKRTA